ncbi:MAG: YraN family protein [Rubricella sp.]
MTGRASYAAGLGAEETVERYYARLGAETLARRFRGGGGEIDLIVRLGGVIVFVEVKARRSLEAAAEAISPAQWGRLEAAARAYIQKQAIASDADMRFDVALLDRAGGLEVIEGVIP